MTGAFAAAAAVAVVAILALVLTVRRGKQRLAGEKVRVENLEMELQEAVTGHQQTMEERRRALAERRQAQEDLREAHDRVLDAEHARGEAVERAERAERSLAASSDDDALLELERLRVEREWGEVTGTAEPLPVPWDASLQAAIAVELEIVREVIGVPTRVELSGLSGVPTPRATGAAARLTSEVIRTLAKVGEELAVSFDPDGALIIRVATMRPDFEPDLAPFGRVERGSRRRSVRAVHHGWLRSSAVPARAGRDSSGVTPRRSRRSAS